MIDSRPGARWVQRENVMRYSGQELYQGLGALAGQANIEPDSLVRLEDTRIHQALLAGGQPALEVGCGSGQLLLRWLAEGLAVDGLDLSLEALGRCLQLARARHLPVSLYWQALQELALPDKYRLIYLPRGTFMHVVERDLAIESLSRLHAQLEPGGQLLLSVYDQSGFAGAGDLSVDRLAPESGRLHIERRALAVDPVEQLITDERRYRLLQGGQVLREERRVGQFRWYTKLELSMLLAWVGFDDIDIRPLQLAEADQPGVTLLASARRRS
jgi:SAM-dependent methyltransferase